MLATKDGDLLISLPDAEPKTLYRLPEGADQLEAMNIPAAALVEDERFGLLVGDPGDPIVRVVEGDTARAIAVGYSGTVGAQTRIIAPFGTGFLFGYLGTIEYFPEFGVCETRAFEGSAPSGSLLPHGRGFIAIPAITLDSRQLLSYATPIEDPCGLPIR